MKILRLILATLGVVAVIALVCMLILLGLWALLRMHNDVTKCAYTGGTYLTTYSKCIYKSQN